jgi:bifunctional non-homologous end joining protein LigD
MPSARPAADPLARYIAKRDFRVTSEPAGEHVKTGPARRFVIQKHWAGRLHYDFRLEHDGVLLSWAVPKGPSFDPADKRMAIHVEDHPVSYGGFEGRIPAGQYGAGTVIVWDQGEWEPLVDVDEGLRAGKLVFRLHGEKLAGGWELIRTGRTEEKKDQWLLFKKRDAWARPHADYDVTLALPESVVEKPLGLAEARAKGGEGNGAAAKGVRAAIPPAKATPDPLAGAVKAALPKTLQPQLATLSKTLPPGRDWIFEFKYDGYRLLARIERGRARLVTRNGNDWTDRMPVLAKEVEALGLTSGWIDGEIILPGPDGLPSFNALQNAFDSARTKDLQYMVFDAPYLEGRDLRQVPLRQRRELLQAVLEQDGAKSPHVRFSAGLEGDGQALWRSACSQGLEGLIAKQADAPYVGDRSAGWLKLKCSQRQEFVVVGYTERTNARDDFGSLLLAVHDDEGKLRYAGNVGTGWNDATRRTLLAHMRPLAIAKPPPGLEAPPRGRWSTRDVGTPHWLRPELVAEVAFAEWTPDGHVRHPSFQGLREDKPARGVTRERARAAPGAHPVPAAKGAAAAPASPARAGKGGAMPKAGPHDAVVGGVKVTHADRVIDASTGLTKLDLLRYYEAVAPRLLPHLKARPVSLVRAPSGVDAPLFFQKHADERQFPGIRQLDEALWPGHEALLEVSTAKALLAAAQMNVVEFHTWNATTRHIDKPDRVIFDLDPGEGVRWPQVQEAALLTHTLLDELGLRAWLKTSGGKGLHVVVPLAPRRGWDEVKDFSKAVVEHLARTIPSRFVAKSGAANRVGRIFVDYLRNGESQTTAAAFSARARPGLGVSMPVDWEALPQLKGGAQWTVATAIDHLSFEQADPWAGYATCRQTLTEALRRLQG